MKYQHLQVVIVILLLAFSCPSFAAANIDEIIADKIQIKKDGTKELDSIIGNNVYSYYKLMDNYDTELKRKAFSKTDEYKEKYEQLVKIKNEALNKSYYIRYKPFSQWEGFFTAGYNIKKQGFYTTFKSEPYYGLMPYVPYLIYDVQFNHFPIEIDRSPSFGQDFIRETMLLKVSEEQAIKIENNKDVDIIMTFKLAGYGDGHLKAACPSQMYFVNRNTGEIYAEKTYPCVTRQATKKSNSKKKK